MLKLYFGYIFCIFWPISAAVLALSTWNYQVHIFRLWLFYGICRLYIKREKEIWLFLAKTFFQFLAHFRQLLWRNRNHLDIARYKISIDSLEVVLELIAWNVTTMEWCCNNILTLFFSFWLVLATILALSTWNYQVHIFRRWTFLWHR